MESRRSLRQGWRRGKHDWGSKQNRRNGRHWCNAWLCKSNRRRRSKRHETGKRTRNHSRCLWDCRSSFLNSHTRKIVFTMIVNRCISLRWRKDGRWRRRPLKRRRWWSSERQAWTFWRKWWWWGRKRRYRTEMGFWWLHTNIFLAFFDRPWRFVHHGNTDEVLKWGFAKWEILWKMVNNRFVF